MASRRAEPIPTALDGSHATEAASRGCASALSRARLTSPVTPPLAARFRHPGAPQDKAICEAASPPSISSSRSGCGCPHHDAGG
jgi:hypothetical protein